jgi:hypothetical protein
MASSTPPMMLMSSTPPTSTSVFHTAVANAGSVRK